jgi:predicted DCC family thiol-disulfide oxidoreductase YuxK
MGSPAQMTQNVVLFDGFCNFCNASVQFILKRDPKGVLKFAPLQSDSGKLILAEYGLPSDHAYSILLVCNNKIYSSSDAVMRIARTLSGLWPVFYYIMLITPRFVRDAAYKWVADHRYRYFGKRDTCMIPNKEQRERFL